ncbi:MAG: alkaline phosphatase family protein [Verrucomicrobia bacterium]|nr:alkaline phosphatase family protein [Verrucomicrobiota bacterium]
MVRRLLFACSSTVRFATMARAEEAAPPKLAVVIAVDQLRADYLVRFRPYFGEGGFKRLLEGGADFRDAHYRHAITHTAPGHALILSGVHSNVHGIIGNEWLVPETWESINCMEDPASPLVGINPAELGPTQAARPDKTGRSLKNFQATTVTDQVKLRYGANSKVFAASNKDRSAMLLGGKLADSAYWDENGKFVTSRAYRDALPAWVEAFNAEKRCQAAFGKVWDRLLDPAIYEQVQGPDDAAGEETGLGLGRTFPKKITGGKDAISPTFYTAFDNSPFSAEFLGEFAQRALVEEKLGRHPATDVLCVSFSQVDTCGHSYGPDSQEVMDSVLRLDRVLAALFARIDQEVGLAKCVIVLTADHGGEPMPERVQALRPDIPAGRIKPADLDAAAKKALDAAYGPLEGKELWFTRDTYAYFVRPAALAAKKLTAADVAKVLKAGLLTAPGIATAFTYVLKPYYQIKTGTGATHGMPYAYDTHVPILWWGAGVPRGVHPERVSVEDIAPTLAALLGVPTPPQAMGRRLF